MQNSTLCDNDNISERSKHRWAEAYKMMWMPNAECPPPTALLGSDNEEQDDHQHGESIHHTEILPPTIAVTELARSNNKFYKESARELASNNERKHQIALNIEEQQEQKQQITEREAVKSTLQSNNTESNTSIHSHELLNKLSNQILMACCSYSSSSSWSLSTCDTSQTIRKPLLNDALLTDAKSILDDDATETYVKNLITAVIALSEQVHNMQLPSDSQQNTSQEEVGEVHKTTRDNNNNATLTNAIHLPTTEKKNEQERHEECKLHVHENVELILDEVCKRLGCESTSSHGNDQNAKHEPEHNYKQMYCDLIGTIKECTQRVNEIEHLLTCNGVVKNNNINNSNNNNSSNSNTKQSNTSPSLLAATRTLSQLVTNHFGLSEAAETMRSTDKILTEITDILENYGTITQTSDIPAVLLHIVSSLEQLQRDKQFDEVLLSEYEHRVQDRFASYGELCPPCVRDEVKRLLERSNSTTTTTITDTTAPTASNVVWLNEPLQSLIRDISVLTLSSEEPPSMEQLLLSSYTSTLLFAPHNNAEQTQVNVLGAIRLAREELQRWRESVAFGNTCNDETSRKDRSNKYINNYSANLNNTSMEKRVKDESYVALQGAMTVKEEEETIRNEQEEQLLALRTIHELISFIPLSLQIKLDIRNSALFTGAHARTLKEVMQSLLQEHLTQEKALTTIQNVTHSLRQSMQLLQREQSVQMREKEEEKLTSALMLTDKSLSSTTEATAASLLNNTIKESETDRSSRPLYAPLMSSIHKLQQVSTALINEVDAHVLHLHEGIYTASYAEIKDAIYKLAEMLVIGSSNVRHNINTTTTTNNNNIKNNSNNNCNNVAWISQVMVEPPSHKLSDMIALVRARWLEESQANQRQHLQLMRVNAEKLRMEQVTRKYVSEWTIILNDMCSAFAKITESNNNNTGNSNSNSNNTDDHVSEQLLPEQTLEKGVHNNTQEPKYLPSQQVNSKHNDKEDMMKNSSNSINDNESNVEVLTTTLTPTASSSLSSSSSLSMSLLDAALIETNNSNTICNSMSLHSFEEEASTLTERLKMLKVKSARTLEQLHASRTRETNLTNNANTTARRMRKAAASIRNICSTLSISVNNLTCQSNNNSTNNKFSVSTISEVEMIRLLCLIEGRVRNDNTLQETALRQSQIVELEREVKQLRKDRLTFGNALKVILRKLRNNGQIMKLVLYLVGTDELASDDVLDEIALFLRQSDECAKKKEYLQQQEEEEPQEQYKKSGVKGKEMQGSTRAINIKKEQRRDFDVSVFSETSEGEDDDININNKNNNNYNSNNSKAINQEITQRATLADASHRKLENAQLKLDEERERAEELLATLLHKFERWTERLQEGVDEHLYTQQKVTRYFEAIHRFFSSAGNREVSSRSNNSNNNIKLDEGKLNNLIDMDEVLMHYAHDILPQLDRVLRITEEKESSSVRNARNSGKAQNEEGDSAKLALPLRPSLPAVPLRASSNVTNESVTREAAGNRKQNSNQDEADIGDAEDVSEVIRYRDEFPFYVSDILPYDIHLEKLHDVLVKLHTTLSSLHRVHYLAIPVAERIRRNGDVELTFDDDDNSINSSSVTNSIISCIMNNNNNSRGNNNNNNDNINEQSEVSEAEEDNIARDIGRLQWSRKGKKSSGRGGSYNTKIERDNDSVGFVNIDLAELVRLPVINEMNEKQQSLTNALWHSKNLQQTHKQDKFTRECKSTFTNSHSDFSSSSSSATMAESNNTQNCSQKDVEGDNITNNCDVRRIVNNEAILKLLTHNAECLYNSAKKFSVMYKSAAILIQKDTDTVQSLLSCMLERYSELDVERAFQQSREELLAMYNVLSEKGTKAKGCYFFTRVNGEGPCVWTAALEQLNVGFGTIIDKLVERTELVTHHRSIIDQVAKVCVNYVNWVLCQHENSLQLPPDIIKACSSRDEICKDNDTIINSDKKAHEHQQQQQQQHIEIKGNDKEEEEEEEEEEEVEPIDVLPPIPTEVPTLTPLEKLITESARMESLGKVNDCDNTNTIAKNKEFEEQEESIKNETNEAQHTSQVTHFTEDEVLAKVIDVLFVQLKEFVARNKSKDEASNVQDKLQSLHAELAALNKQTQILEEERDKALSSAAVARTELRRWLRQSGLNDQSTETTNRTTYNTILNSSNTTNNNNRYTNSGVGNVDADMLQVTLPEIAYPSSVSSLTTATIKNSSINNSNNNNNNNENESLQAILSPPTEITQLELLEKFSTHSDVIKSKLASFQLQKDSISSPSQLEAIKQYLCALNAELEFAEGAIGKHKKWNTSTPSEGESRTPRTNLRKKEPHPDTHYESDSNTTIITTTTTSSGSSNNYNNDDNNNNNVSYDYEMEPRSNITTMTVNNKDLVVTPSPHRYAVHYTERKDNKARRERSRELQRQRQQHTKHSVLTEEREESKEKEKHEMMSSSSNTANDSYNIIKDKNKYRGRSYNTISHIRVRANSSNNRNNNNNNNNKNEKTNESERRGEVQKAIAVKHLIERNRHFPPSREQQKRRDQEEKYLLDVNSNRLNHNKQQQEEQQQSLSLPRSTLHVNNTPHHEYNIQANRNTDNTINYIKLNSESKSAVANTNINDLSYFKLTPSETKRLLRQSRSRSSHGGSSNSSRSSNSANNEHASRHQSSNTHHAANRATTTTTTTTLTKSGNNGNNNRSTKTMSTPNAKQNKFMREDEVCYGNNVVGKTHSRHRHSSNTTNSSKKRRKQSHYCDLNELGQVNAAPPFHLDDEAHGIGPDLF